MRKKIAKVVVGFFIFAAIVGVSVFYLLDGQEREAFVDLSTDKVPTLYTVVGERSLRRYSVDIDSGVEEGFFVRRTFVYKAGAVSLEDIERYVERLCAENFIVTQPVGASGKAMFLVKELQEAGKIILVDINMLETGFTVSYRKVDGNLARFEK